jgi:hypothetical protein
VVSDRPESRVWAVDGIEAEVWVEPSAEQRFWVRRVPSLFAPEPGREGLLATWLAIATVVPSTNVTNFSLRYQSYLNDVFHTTRTARWGHAVCMPIVVVLTLTAAEAVGVRALLAAVLLGWWLAWAALERDPVWAAALAVTWAAVVGASVGLTRLGVEPWGPLALAVFLQALSHVPEPLPPRVSRSPAWVPLRVYLTTGSGAERVRRFGHVAAQAAFGTVDEWIASPRLLPVLVSGALGWLGWRAARRAEWKAVSARAMATGNPAIDYIGIGGGTRLRP